MGFRCKACRKEKLGKPRFMNLCDECYNRQRQEINHRKSIGFMRGK